MSGVDRSSLFVPLPPANSKPGGGGMRGMIATITKVPPWVWLMLLIVVIGIGFGATLYTRAERSRLREEHEKELARIRGSFDHLKRRMSQMSFSAAADNNDGSGSSNAADQIVAHTVAAEAPEAPQGPHIVVGSTTTFLGDQFPLFVVGAAPSNATATPKAVEVESDTAAPVAAEPPPQQSASQ